MEADWDCLVVGAGPAGLSAALYLARFRRRVLVLHDGKARAARIPLTHNVPGFADGIAGPALLKRMAEHATRYGAEIRQAEVAAAERTDDCFKLQLGDGGTVMGRALILATGLHLNQIPLPHDVHEAAIRANVLRYCPVCDGYEHIDKRIAVIGCDADGADEALFLRGYTDRVTLLPRVHAELSAARRDELAAAGIQVEDRPVARYAPDARGFDIHLEDDATPMHFDVVYPALGVRQRTELAAMLGLPLDEVGCVAARSPLGTEVPGLYCAGDIVDGLDQITVAMGHGAVAATRAHNWLRDQAARAMHCR